MGGTGRRGKEKDKSLGGGGVFSQFYFWVFCWGGRDTRDKSGSFWGVLQERRGMVVFWGAPKRFTSLACMDVLPQMARKKKEKKKSQTFPFFVTFAAVNLPCPQILEMAKAVGNIFYTTRVNFIFFYCKRVFFGKWFSRIKKLIVRFHFAKTYT